MTATLGYVTNWQVLQWMNELIAVDSYVSLHFTDPGPVPDNPSATEVAGASYVRAKVTWVTPITSPRALVSKQLVEWRGLPETAVTHLGIWDAATNGHMRAVIPRTDPLYVISDGYFSLKAGDIFLRWP